MYQKPSKSLDFVMTNIYTYFMLYAVIGFELQSCRNTVAELFRANKHPKTNNELCQVI